MKAKILNVLISLKKHWKLAPDGRFIPFREIASLAIGGIGVKFIVYCVSTMIISIGNSLIGNTIGIDPAPMYIIYVLSVIASFPLTGLRAKMIDNSRSMKGKYRPYILTMGLPTVLLGIGFIWAPYEIMSMPVKCITVLLFNIGFQFFYMFMCDANDNIINVLSPNSIERTDVYAVKSVIENISPSIASIFLPLVAKAITGDNTLYNLTIYRVLYPPMLIVGFLVSIIIYVNTEERIIQPKNHTATIGFLDALRAVARNKYFWIISLAGWLGFLEGSFGKILEWMYNYQGACTPGQYALITAIVGNASLWPNLFAPILIRRFGKKKVLIASNIANIIFIALMLPVIRSVGLGSIWFLLVFVFINQLLTSCGHFMNPSLNADIRDYQQYITGERIDGMFSAVGLVGSVVTLATGSISTAIYEKAGLNKATAVSMGYSADNVYDVLFDADLFQSVCSTLIIASVIGAALNVLPFFLYDLTETKQKAMISVLKIRAFFEDKMNNTSTPEQESEVTDIINKAKVYADKTPVKTAKRMSKEEKKRIRQDNEQIKISQTILNELNYFNSPSGILEVEYSKKILSGEAIDVSGTLSQMKNLPKRTAEEKEFRSKMISSVKNITIAKKTQESNKYKNSRDYDESVLLALFSISDNLTLKIGETQKKLKQAKENKQDTKELKIKLSALHKEQQLTDNKIKAARKRGILYNRVNKPLDDAKKCIARYESYQQFANTI